MSHTDEESFDQVALINSQFDTPPLNWTRHDLDTRYPLPLPNKRATKPRQLSMLEKLPTEIRQQIFFYVGCPVAGKMWTAQGVTKVPSEISIGKFWYRSNPALVGPIMVDKTDFGYPGPAYDLIQTLLCINKAFREELLQLLFRNVKVTVVSALSGLSLPYSFSIDTIMESWGYQPAELNVNVFTYLTAVVLSPRIVHSDRVISQTFHGSKHASINHALRTQARAIRFIATHCQGLVSLKFTATRVQYKIRPRDWSDYRHIRGAKDLLIHALEQLVCRCKHLELLQIERILEFHHIFPDGRLAPSGWRWWETDYDTKVEELALTHVPSYMRVEKMQIWAKEFLDVMWKRGNIDRLWVHEFPS